MVHYPLCGNGAIYAYFCVGAYEVVIKIALFLTGAFSYGSLLCSLCSVKACGTSNKYLKYFAKTEILKSCHVASV